MVIWCLADDGDGKLLLAVEAAGFFRCGDSRHASSNDDQVLHVFSCSSWSDGWIRLQPDSIPVPLLTKGTAQFILVPCVVNSLERDNAIDTFPERLQICRSQLENVHQQLEAAKAEVQVPFPREEELKTKSARLEGN